MNLALLDLAEVQAPLPEVIEDKLTAQDDVLVCAFNRRGNLLAGGCRNGAVNIWDFDTHGVAQTLVGHTQRVSSVSWTRSSRRLLSGSADGKLILWDVLRGVATQTVDLEAEVGHAALHPRQRALSLACVGTAAAAQAFIVGLKTPDDPRLPLMAAPEGAAAAADGGGGGASSAGAPAPDAEVKRREGTVSFACFACDGAMVMLGTTRGTCHLLDTSTRTELHSLRLPGGAAIKSLSLSRDGKSFLANSADRVIRAYSLERVLAGERPPPRELQDVVNRVQWAHAGFSSESEHVVGTANSATDHLVYIWDMHGLLVNILGQGEKVKDGATFFACHPTRPILAACARSGAVYVWTKRYSENWSAFAPDFKELDENEEYAEREDEFDIKPQADFKANDVDEDEVIDILTVERTELAHVPDADDDDDELLFIPVTPIAQDAATADGTAMAAGLIAGGAGADDDDGTKGKGRAGKRKAPG